MIAALGGIAPVDQAHQCLHNFHLNQTVIQMPQEEGALQVHTVLQGLLIQSCVHLVCFVISMSLVVQQTPALLDTFVQEVLVTHCQSNLFVLRVIIVLQ